MAKPTILFASIASAFALGASAATLSAQSGTTFGSEQTGAFTVSGASDSAYWQSEDSGEVGAIAALEEAQAKTSAISDANESQYLSIDTVSPLYRTAEAVVEDAATAVDVAGGLYFDSLVQFTDSQINPSSLATADGKIYVWLQDGVLKVKAGYLGEEGVEPFVYNTTASVTAGEWYRLTIKAIDTIKTGETVPAFMVYLDGAALQYSTETAAGYDMTGLNAVGAMGYNTTVHSIFPSLDQTTATITAVGFEGVGACDDIVFTTTAPAFASDPVAVVGNTYYATLAEALVASSADQERAFLVRDTDEVVTVPAGSTFYLSENGHYFTGKFDGAGTVNMAAKPSAAESESGLFASTWTGTFQVAWNPDNSNYRFNFNDLGNANSKVEILGASGSFIALPSTNWGTSDGSVPTILPELVVSCSVTINNGWNTVTTIKKLSGTGTLTVNGAGSAGDAIPYTIESLDGFTGTLAGNRGCYTLGDIVVSGTPAPGDLLVKLNVGLYEPVIASATVNGAAPVSPLCRVSHQSVSGVYLAAAQSDSGVYFVDVATAIAATGASSNNTAAHTVTVFDGSSAEYAGWTLENGVYTQTGAVRARIGETGYATLALAVAAAGEAETEIDLVAVCSETVTIPANVTVKVADGVNFRGTISGAGRVVYTAAPGVAPVFGEWTGTVALDYAGIANAARLDTILNQYGIDGSTVEIGENGTVTGDCHLNEDLVPALAVNGYMMLNNGSSYTERTIPSLTGSGTFVFGSSGARVNYRVTSLVDWNGSLTNQSAGVGIANIVSGDGEVVYASTPDIAPTVADGFTGTIYLNFNYHNYNIAIYGGANSTRALGSMTGHIHDGAGEDGQTGVVPGATVVAGDVLLNNAWTLGVADWTNAKTVKFDSLKVDGTLTLDSTASNWNTARGYVSAGSLDASGAGSIAVGDGFSLKIGAVDFAAAPSGNGCQVALSLDEADLLPEGGKLFGPNGVENELIPVTVDGVANGMMLKYAAADGEEGTELYTPAGLYLVPARVESGAGAVLEYSDNLTAALTTLETALATDSGAKVVIMDGTVFTQVEADMLGNMGYVYDSANGTISGAVARIGSTIYGSLQAAIDGASADASSPSTITLVRPSAEAVTLAKSVVFAENGKAFTGTISGAGKIRVNAAPSATTWSASRFSGWTGTFVVGWDASGKIMPDKYGISGSTVEYAVAISSGYFNTDSTGLAAPSVAPALYFNENVTLTDGFANAAARTTFAKIGMASGKTFSTRGRANGDKTYYTITVLDGFEGTLDIRGNDRVTIGTIVCSAAPEAGQRVVAATTSANGVSNAAGGFDGLSAVQVKAGEAEAATVPMAFATIGGASGLYKAVAQTGGANYATYADAVAAQAEGAEIAVLDASAGNVPEGWAIVNGYLVRTGVACDSAGVYYASLAEAVAGAPADGTVTLLENAALDATITVSKNLTLDLAGFNVTATDCRAFWVKAGSFAITGSGTVSTEVTQGTAFADSSSVVRVGDSVNTGTAASFTLGANATVASDYCYGVTYFGPNPMTVVLNGTVAVTGAQPAISGVGTSAGSATVTVAGAVSATQDYAIYNPQRGTTTVAGTATVTGGIEVKGGNLVVQNGATITARDVAESHSANSNGSSTAGYAIATVYAAGNYAGGVKPTASIGAANITGKVVALAEGSATEIAEVTATSNEIAVPEGYRWEETEEEGVYTLAQIVMHLEPASMELYPNCSNYVYVVDAPAGSTFYFKYAGAGVGSGGFSKTEGWGKPYAKAPGTNGTVTAYVTNNNVEVGVLVCNVTVKDVVAKIGSVEYAKAQWAEAVNAAIASGEVLEVYYNAGTVTLAEGQTLRWKAADNRNQGKVVARAAPATETAMFKVTSTTDSSTGVTTAVCTNEGAPNVQITKANGDVSYSATLSPTTANATYKLLRSFTCGKVSADVAGVTLDLNGQTLTTTSYIYVRKLTGGASLTITDTSAGGAGAIVGTGTEAYPLIWAANDKSQAEVVIEAGSFTAAGNGVAVYTSDGGVATINGGTFRTTKDSAAFLLNCQDAYKGTITVNGGVFYGFDPANNTADGAGTNFLGENKQSVETSAGVFTVSDIPAGLQVKVGDTVIEFAETANALTATLPSGATLDDVKVIAATGEDVTAGFAKTLEGETVTLALKPVEYAAETDDTAALWTDNGDGTVTLNVVLVPGLYYAAASSATLGGLAKPAEMTQAAAGTTLTAPKPAGATGFFQVWVAIEPPAGE